MTKKGQDKRRIGQTKDRKNEAQDKLRIGQTKDRTKERRDKCRVGQSWGKKNKGQDKQRPVQVQDTTNHQVAQNKRLQNSFAMYHLMNVRTFLIKHFPATVSSTTDLDYAFWIYSTRIIL